MSKHIAKCDCIMPEGEASNPSKKSQSGADSNTKLASEKKADKSRKMKMEKMLEGTINVVPHPDYKAGTVYDLEGLSVQFDGAYYTKQCTHTISTSGYSVTMSVIKTELGGGLPYTPENTSRKKKAENEVKAESSHKVKKGDTLSAIAKKNGTTVDALVKANGIKNRDLIYPNQVIKIVK